ncbi:MAG: delta-lactam-biosynthetic de-N-acetylase, partial [Clostridium sp.]
IMLLHAVSKTNTNVLKDVITQLKNEGYEFKSLNDLPEK